MDQRDPESRRFTNATEMCDYAKVLVEKYLNDTDYAPGFVVRDIAEYQRPHAIALAAQVFATLDPCYRDGFGSVLKRVVFGPERRATPTFRDEFGDDPRIEPLFTVESDAYTAIFVLAENLAERFRDGTDDVYAAAVRTIARMSVNFAILVTFIVCSVLDGRHTRAHLYGFVFPPLTTPDRSKPL